MFKKIKNWYKLAETNKGLIVLHVVFTMLRVIGLIISPIFVAKVTTCLTQGDYNGAWLNLTIEILVMSISLFSYFQVYCNASRLFKNTYMNVQQKIYKKAYRAKESNFEITSKEKLLNIIGTDIDVISNFADALGVKLGKVFQVVLTLAMVFSYNWIVGLAILGLSVINFFILIKLNKGIANHKRSMYENKDKIYEKFSRILSNQPIIKEYDMGQDIADNYFQKCENYTKSFKKNKNLCGVKDALFVNFYKIMIFLITFFMIFLVKNGTLQLTLYLILVSYLLTSTELINEIINISANIEEVDVSRNRINTVLNFTDAEWIKFGNLTDIHSTNELNLINVSYSNIDKTSPFYGSISNIDMNFKPYALNLVKGPRNCGKRIIFNLISRKIAPANGKILLSNIDIYEYEQKYYKHKVFSAFGKPMFIDGSIISNFNIVEKNKDIIYECCKSVGIFDYIESLPEKFETDINKSNIPSEKLFLIGLAMSMLKRPKVLLIYELPKGLSKDEKEEIKKSIEYLSTLKTVVLFTSSSSFDNDADRIFTINDGKIINQSDKSEILELKKESQITKSSSTTNTSKTKKSNDEKLIKKQTKNE